MELDGVWPFCTTCPICNQTTLNLELHEANEHMIPNQFRIYVHYHDVKRRLHFINIPTPQVFDAIQQLISYNLCEDYPDVTIRYFAVNWPKYCIVAFTDGGYPVGIIMAYPEEPNKAKIVMFAVSSVLLRKCIYKTLLELLIKELKRDGINQVVLHPQNPEPKKQFREIFGEHGPFRHRNWKMEYYFPI